MNEEHELSNDQGIGPDVAGSRCCGVLRGATADASRATTRLFRLPGLGVCHISALAAAYEQPAEAAAEGRYACTESLLRLGHSSHNLSDLDAVLSEFRQTGKSSTSYAEGTGP